MLADVSSSKSVWQRSISSMKTRTVARVILIAGMLLVIGDLIGFVAGKRRGGGPMGMPAKIYKKHRKGRK